MAKANKEVGCKMQASKKLLLKEGKKREKVRNKLRMYESEQATVMVVQK